MRAAQLVEAGTGLDGLRLGDVATPVPGPDEVLVRVAAVSASKLDLEQTMAGVGLGRAVRPPVILGMDPAGTVVAQGDQIGADLIGIRVAVKPNVVCAMCDNCRSGQEADCIDQRVLGVHRDGGLAEFVAVPVQQTFVIPERLDFVTAAAGVHTVAVARHLLAAAGDVDGRTVVVLGGSGAVGSTAAQLAAAAGARVLAVGSALERLRTALPPAERIQPVVSRSAGDLSAAIRSSTAEPVAAVLDAAGGGALLSAAIDLLGWGGVAVTCASAPGDRLDVDLGALYRTRRTVKGVGASNFAEVCAALDDLAAGRVRLRIAGEFPLARVHDAYRALADRTNVGKTIVTVP